MQRVGRRGRDSARTSAPSFGRVLAGRQETDLGARKLTVSQRPETDAGKRGQLSAISCRLRTVLIAQEPAVVQAAVVGSIAEVEVDSRLTN